MTVLKDFGWYNVQDIAGGSLDADGTGDWGPAIQWFVDNVAIEGRGNSVGQFAGVPEMSFNTSGTTRLVFPTRGQGPGGQAVYRIETPVIVPGNKPIRFSGDGFGGAVLENATGTDEMFVMDGVTGDRGTGTFSQFDGLTFWKGGVKYEGRFRGYLEVNRCAFYETPAPALNYVDGGDAFAPIGMRIHDNRFFLCAGSIAIQDRQSGIIGKAWRNRHLWNRDTPIVVDGADMTIIEDDFTIMEETAGLDSPYILIRDRDEPNAFVNIELCRFAPEVALNFPDGFTYRPPWAAVQVGETPDNASVVSNVNMRANRFLGEDPADPSASHGLYGVAFLSRPVNCTIDGNNSFTNLGVASIGEQWTNGGVLNTGQEDRNFYGWNSNSTSVPDIFEYGGQSWLQPWVRDTATPVNNAALYAHDTAGGLHELLDPPAAGGPATWSPVVGPF